MGHNGKTGRCEPGRADTLICDRRGRAICFSSTEPTHLSKTMKPLAQLRRIVPAGRILLGFDRGGAYAEAFTASTTGGLGPSAWLHAVIFARLRFGPQRWRSVRWLYPLQIAAIEMFRSIEAGRSGAQGCGRGRSPDRTWPGKSA